MLVLLASCVVLFFQDMWLHGGHMMMMYFHGGYDEVILFDAW